MFVLKIESWKSFMDCSPLVGMAVRWARGEGLLEIRDGAGPADGERMDALVCWKKAFQLVRHVFSPMQEVPTQEFLIALFKMCSLWQTILGIKQA